MALLPILEVPNDMLRRKAAPVTDVDDALKKLFDDMLETMYAAPGIGLAGPQIGVSSRVLVLDVTPRSEPKRHPIRMANPEILWCSPQSELDEEGCLSLPDLYADVRRPKAIRLKFLNEHGVEEKLEAEGLLARVIQHEVDHLDGVLFVDHLSRLKRDMLLRKLNKTRRLKAS